MAPVMRNLEQHWYIIIPRPPRRPGVQFIKFVGVMTLLLSVSLVLGACTGSSDVTPRATRQPRNPTAATVTSTARATTPRLSSTRPQAATALPTMTPTPFAPPDLAYLAAAYDNVLDEFHGEASYAVIDLQSGASISQHADVAISGMSIVKIPILLETYRVLDEPPDPAQTRLITETATLSGNYTANLLLELVAGRPDPFAGAETATRSLRRLGLHNSFIAVPYDEEARPAFMATYLTPANQNGEFSTNPDPSMQTTARDMARLLQMIYECSQGRGLLLDTFGGELTAGECTAVLEVMKANKIGAFIEAGVPAGVPVAHKHGWVGDTHGDAGVVFAEGKAYVLAVALYRPGWLEWADSTKIIAELSRLAYAHFSDASAYAPSLLSTPPAALGFQATTPTATPNLPRLWVTDTGGVGLAVRDAPGGAELTVLPEGSYAYRSPGEPVAAGGFTWVEIVAPSGVRGWAVSDFLLAQ